MTYAGRLDPIASGLMLVLAGDAVYEKDAYLKLEKVYHCTAVLGFDTDTYDILGVPTPQAFGQLSLLRGAKASGDLIKKALGSFIGAFEQSYPPYSSKTVKGKQLHQIAREGKMDEIVVPKQTVTVKSIKDIKLGKVSIKGFLEDIIKTIAEVKGDFRQKEITDAWQKILKSEDRLFLETVSFSITVSGGTYIRGVVNELGTKLGCGACVWKLERSKIGNYSYIDISI